MRKIKSFTLIELLITVIIFAVLASFAFGQYVKMVERSKGAKAKRNLILISQAERLYHSDNDIYLAVAIGEVNDSPGLGAHMDLSGIANDTDWDYEVTGVTPSTFLATAIRTAGSYKDGFITRNQDGAMDDSNFIP